MSGGLRSVGGSQGAERSLQVFSADPNTSLDTGITGVVVNKIGSMKLGAMKALASWGVRYVELKGNGQESIYVRIDDLAKKFGLTGAEIKAHFRGKEIEDLAAVLTTMEERVTEIVDKLPLNKQNIDGIKKVTALVCEFLLAGAVKFKKNIIPGSYEACLKITTHQKNDAKYRYLRKSQFFRHNRQ